MINKVFLGIGIALLVFIPIWIFLVVPEMEKLPKDYGYETNLFGTENVYNIEIGDFEGEEVVKVNRKVVAKEIEGDNLFVNDHFSSSFLDGEVYYSTNQGFTVNRKTKKIEGTGAYFEFPRDLKKQEYNVWFYYLTEPFIVEFEKEEKLLGLDTFLFSYELEFDATSGFSDSDELVPETYYIKESPNGKIWVEPISGIIVKLEDSGIDYYVEKTDNVLTAQEVSPTFKWTAKYNDDTIANQVRIAQNEKQRIILIEWIVPILLALIGLAFFSAYYISKKHIFTNENTDNTEKKVETKKSSIKTKKPLVTLNENKEKDEK
jgi:hypothetical protein